MYDFLKFVSKYLIIVEFKSEQMYQDSFNKLSKYLIIVEFK